MKRHTIREIKCRNLELSEGKRAHHTTNDVPAPTEVQNLQLIVFYVEFGLMLHVFFINRLVFYEKHLVGLIFPRLFTASNDVHFPKADLLDSRDLKVVQVGKNDVLIDFIPRKVQNLQRNVALVDTKGDN